MRRLSPSRGDVWLIDFNPTRGHEQSGIRPAVIVSSDPFNHGPALLAVAVPMTTRRRNVRLHVSVSPPEGGIREQSFVKCEDIRSVSVERLLEWWGTISTRTMALIEDRLRILMEL